MDVEEIPVQEQEPTILETLETKDSLKEIPAETIEIPKQTIVNYLKPQNNKFWRFTFKNDVNNNRFKQLIESLEKGLTVEFQTKQETPDVLITLNGEPIGKINLLLCDRRDANLPEKYYCKIHFFHFKNPELYNKIKTVVINFFLNLHKFKNTNNMNGGRNRKYKRTYKKKQSNYKKTSKRKNYRK